jgi:hypothetical protein
VYPSYENASQARSFFTFLSYSFFRLIDSVAMEKVAQASMLSSVRTFLECASDNVFGPFSDCRFDFTLFFEQAIISAIPAIFLLLSAPSRIDRLFRQDEKVLPSTNGVAKLVSF